jgi:hypothetical protein
MKTKIRMNRMMKYSGLEHFIEKAPLLRSALAKSSLAGSANIKNALVKSALGNIAMVKSTMAKSAMVLAVMIIMTSCGKIEKPEIGSFELGYENSKIAYVGADLHINAEVVAEGTIDRIHIVIHPEGEHGKKGLRSAVDEGEWEVDTTYTKFSGLKNTTFHEHIEIPMDAEPGDYHFHFEVTDMEGYQTVIEEELEIKIPEDAVAPEITISSAPTEDKVWSNGESISISGSLSDDKALGGVYIGLVREDQSLTDAEVNATNTITILHTHDFDSPTSHDFSASIEVGAAQDNNITPKDISGDIAWQSANYYILVKCKDAFGGNWTFSDHYPIVIDY